MYSAKYSQNKMNLKTFLENIDTFNSEKTRYINYATFIF